MAAADTRGLPHDIMEQREWSNKTMSDGIRSWRLAGNEAHLETPQFAGGGSMNFFYHMHGKTMGMLSLEAKKGNRWYTIWHKQGQQHTSQKAAWSQGRANIPARTTQIRFRGTKQRT